MICGLVLLRSCDQDINTQSLGFAAWGFEIGIWDLGFGICEVNSQEMTTNDYPPIYGYLLVRVKRLRSSISGIRFRMTTHQYRVADCGYGKTTKRAVSRSGVRVRVSYRVRLRTGSGLGQGSIQGQGRVRES